MPGLDGAPAAQQARRELDRQARVAQARGQHQRHARRHARARPRRARRTGRTGASRGASDRSRWRSSVPSSTPSQTASTCARGRSGGEITPIAARRPGVDGLVEQQVLRAGLAGHVEALGARPADRRHAAGRGDVHDVDRRLGQAREVERAADALLLDERRARARMGVDAEVAGRAQPLAQHLDRAGVLAVQPRHDAVLAAPQQRAQEHLVVGVHAELAIGEEELDAAHALRGERRERGLVERTRARTPWRAARCGRPAPAASGAPARAGVLDALARLGGSVGLDRGRARAQRGRGRRRRGPRRRARADRSRPAARSSRARPARARRPPSRRRPTTRPPSTSTSAPSSTPPGATTRPPAMRSAVTWARRTPRRRPRARRCARPAAPRRTR